MAANTQDNSLILQQVAVDTNTLKAIDLANVKPEGFSTALSLTLALSLSILSKVQSLPIAQRSMIEAEVKQVIEAVERAVAKAQSDVAEEEKRSKGGYKLALLEGMPPLFAVLEETAKTNKALNSALISAQQFVVFQNVLAIPTIANQHTPLSVMHTVISSVLPPVQTAHVLQSYVSVVAPHEMLTNFVGNESAMNSVAPQGLTRNVLDNFMDVTLNQHRLQQFGELHDALQQSRQQALLTGESTEAIDRVDQEIKETTQVVTTVINQANLKDEILLIRKRIEDRGEVVTPLGFLKELKIMQTEGSLVALSDFKIATEKEKDDNLKNFSNELSLITKRIEERGDEVNRNSILAELKAMKNEGVNNEKNQNASVQEVSLDNPVASQWTSKVNTQSNNNSGRSIS